MNTFDRKPSVGRIVHFFEKQGQAQAAIVTQVLSDDVGTVNLTVFDHLGMVSGRGSINPRTQQSQTYVWDWPDIIQ